MPELTGSDVLHPETPTHSLEVPTLHQAGTSVGQLAYDALRGAILAMDVYDEDADLRLDEKRLAAGLGVSRTPVREALARLEHEGLVRILPRRGVSIVRKTKAEIVEMIIAWAALEATAARLACERAADDEIASLRRDFEPDETLADRDEYSRANLRFHARIIELGHSPLMVSMAEGLLVHMRAIRRGAIGDSAERSSVDHRQIVEALEARDADLAERLVREHGLGLARHVEQTVTHLD
jgi:DNA-binding GntR family transcriptional regulator